MKLDRGLIIDKCLSIAYNSYCILVTLQMSLVNNTLYYSKKIVLVHVCDNMSMPASPGRLVPN